jgi:hypothetical protein
MSKGTIDEQAYQATTQNSDKNRQYIDIPTGGGISMIGIHHRGVLNWTGADFAALAPDESFANLFQNFRLEADGLGEIVSGVGCRSNSFRCEKLLGKTLNGSTALAITDDTDNTVDLIHYLFFGIPNFPKLGRHPLARDSVLDASAMTRLRLYWDDKKANGNIGTTGPNDAWATNTLKTVVFCKQVPLTGQEQWLLTLDQEDFSYDSARVYKRDERDSNYYRGCSFLSFNNGELADTVLGQMQLETQRQVGGLKVTSFPLDMDFDEFAAEEPTLSGIARTTGTLFVPLDDEGTGEDVENFGDCTLARWNLTVAAAGTGTRIIKMLHERLRFQPKG